MKYSVIIPAYNSEKTIKRCIGSIALQDRSDVEIIVINDGSTDETDGICKALQTEHNNIIYVCKENGGVSSARNTGFSVATGEFGMFVDSDDYVDAKCFDIKTGKEVKVSSFDYGQVIAKYKDSYIFSGTDKNGNTVFEKILSKEIDKLFE